MTNVALERLVWVLIYGGLLALCLGLFVTLLGGWVGWFLKVGGVGATAAGVALIWVRSRRKDSATK
jgi:hypothetical protein